MIITNSLFSTPSGGTPGDIVLPSLVSWHEADDISTLWTDSARTTQVASDGDVVGAWDDKSGNGNHLLQATTSKKPTYQSDAGNTLNSLPTILGDGTDDWLQATFSTESQPLHIFIVTRQNTWTVSDKFFDGAGATEMSLAQHNIANRLRQNVTGSYSTINTGLALSTFELVENLYDGASGHLKVAAGTPSTGAANVSSISGLTMFARGDGVNNSDVNIAEVVLCNTALTGSTLTDLRDYFNTKWGVTV